jgi:hypothetical protein
MPKWPGHVHRRVAEVGELQVAHRLLVDDVEAPEGEEQVHLDAFAEGGVGEDQAGVGHVEVALGANDRELATGRRLGSSNDGTIMSVIVIFFSS